jgi:hypothetical protein
MSQNAKNHPSEGQNGASGKGRDGNNGRRYEGFEGMNFEQRRQPYNPRHVSYDKKQDTPDGGEPRGPENN